MPHLFALLDACGTFVDSKRPPTTSVSRLAKLFGYASVRRYLFVAIDRATRWGYLRIYADQSEASSIDFLHRLHAVAPMKIEKLLNDNGSQITDRFTSKT